MMVAGVVKARIIEVRFALAGKVSKVNRFAGDRVKKWDLIAALDRTILQTELDRQLSDYEKVRADFEIFAQKNKEPVNDLEKYLKAEKQASLNASVKEVELAKAKLDQSNLLSPVDGIIFDDGGIVAGQYVTPASSALKVIDTSSYYLEIEVEQKDLSDFQTSVEATIKIEGMEKEIKSDSQPVFSDGKKFIVKFPITESSGVLLGMLGKVDFIK